MGFQERDYFYDIETLPDGSICCLSLVDRESEDTYFISAFPVNLSKVEEQLRNEVWLKKHCGKETDVPGLGGKFYGEICSSERDMLLSLKKKLDSLEIHNISAWNAEFDKQVTEDRCRVYKIFGMFEKLTVFDLMQSFSILNKNDSYRGRAALKYSCISELGYGKLEDDGERIASNLGDYVDENPELLACYNVWDSVIIRRLDIKKNIVQFYRTYTDFAICNIEDFFNNIKMIETLIMHRNYPQKIVLNSKHWRIYKGRIEGGFVMQPKVGLFLNSFELDLTKAYPTTIISGNYSTETYVERMWEVCKHGEKCQQYLEERLVPEACWGCRRFVPKPDIEILRVPSGRVYRKDKKGLFPELLKMLRDLRIEYQIKLEEVKEKIANYEKSGDYETADALKPIKETLWQKQFTMKSISNSFYGVLASPKFRLTNSDIAADVTHVVRNLVKWNIDNLKTTKLEYEGVSVEVEPIYTDTDGVKCAIVNQEEIKKHLGRGLSFKDVDAIATMYEDFLNGTYANFSEETFGHRDAEFEVKKENIYQALYIWGAKKNYLYKTFPYGDRPSKVVKVGIKRSDRNKVFKDFTDEVGNLILDTQTKEVGKVVRLFETSILSGEKDGDLGTPQGVGKELNIDGRPNSFYESMMHSNAIFGKEFQVHDKPVFWKCKSIRGKPLPKNKIVALEYGDKPEEFGLILDREKYLSDLKTGVEGFLAPIGTWDALKSNLSRENVNNLWG